MKLSELISEIGDENIRVQFIANSLVGFKECKHDLEVTFATEKQNKPLSDKSKVGIVLWVCRDIYENAAMQLEN
ncbi:MAG: hypothetical protein RR413_08750 [Christensenellaceae bacterium]